MQQFWKNSRGEWYVAVQFILFALVAFGPKQLPGFPTWGGSAITFIGGFIIGAVGFVFIVLGLIHLGANLSVLPHPKADSELVESGAYRLVRHPIYAGIILGAFGWALLWASSLVILYAIILFIFFDIKSRREERWLAKKFPTYSDYRGRVKKLIPFIY